MGAGMRLSVTSGSFSSAFGLVGAGMLALFPDAHWIGWLLVTAGILVFLFDVRIDHGDVQVNWATRVWSLFERRLPLHDAARLLYEAADVLKYIAPPEEPADKRLQFFKHTIMICARLYGVKPPSTQSRLIRTDEISSLHPQAGTSNLTSITAQHEVEYENVTVSRRDLRRILREQAESTKRFAR
jgi:hypothetical protein